MKNQNNQHRQFVLLAGIAALFIFGALNSTFAQGIGAPYGAREPRVCKDKKQPRTGALTAAQAKEYLICDAEKVFGVDLGFVEDVTVEVGKPRPYNIKEDFNYNDIDTKFPIYPIRGSYKSYNCQPINGDGRNRGKNCSIYDNPNAKGSCYKNSFGDWTCAMTDAYTGKFIATDVPPPGGVVVPAAAVTDKKDARNNNERPTAETKTETGAKDDSGYPKPDFTALEKWFEIVRYEYAPDERKLYIYLKSKAVCPYDFKIEFRDKDGRMLQDTTVSWLTHLPGSTDPLGELKKVEVNTPSEKDMAKVASAKIVRFVQ